MDGGSLEIGFALDRRWSWMTRGVERSKKDALRRLARVLEKTRTPYALIGGVALQLHQEEPRTTLDIDVAVLDVAKLPTSALAAAGFRHTGSHAHSDNWEGSDGTPLQFTDDPALHAAIRSAEVVSAGKSVPLRVVKAVDLLHAKLRAAADPARRRSKRLQDFADAEGLIERDPTLAKSLTDAEKRLLERLPK